MNIRGALDHSVAVVGDLSMAAHDPGPGHPESPRRIEAIAEVLSAAGLATSWIAPVPITASQLSTVHNVDYLAKLEASRGMHRRLDEDTCLSPASLDACALAAGAAVEAVDAVLDGRVRRSFALCRPPGHHALPHRAMGFCVYGNVALAVMQARARGLERILVLDWDVHHGNGTQAVFEDDPHVLFVSLHRHPFWPDTGHSHERGTGDGLGYTVNIPMPDQCTDGDYLHVLTPLLNGIAHAFRPELVVVSAGFDPHRDDPIGDQRVSASGFASMTGLVQALADRVCDGRLVLALEGGYDLRGTAESVRDCLAVMTGATPEDAPRPTLRADAMLRELATYHPDWLDGRRPRAPGAHVLGGSER